MTHRRTRILLATSLSLALLGLVPGPTAAAAPSVPALTAPTAVPTKKNVIKMKPGKTYRVKMDGKTRKVKWTRTRVNCDEDGCSKRERLYINSKKVLTRYSGAEEYFVGYTLAKVTSKETLVNVTFTEQMWAGVDVLYRFNGKKLVKVADRESISKKLRNFGADGQEELHLTKAGSGKLTLRYSYLTESSDGYRNATFKYSKGKLKK